jgi:hypothetical protein
MAFALSLGCGDSAPVAYVSGKAEYEGKSVPVGTRIFFERPDTGYLAAGVIGEDGRYSLKHKRSPKVVPGEFVVFVGPPPSNLSEREFFKLKKKTDVEFRKKGKKPPRSPDWVLPAEYYLSTTSPLRKTVGPGDNVIDLTLED